MAGWLDQFQSSNAIAYSLLLLATVAMTGLALGSVRVRGIGLGVSGVLFAGLLFGHLGLAMDPTLLGFVREFGLILFVYTIGMQVGPGFFTSLRRRGLPLNLMATGIVLLGALLALLIGRLGRFDIALTAGIFAGATTNTPALGAAQEALKGLTAATAEQQALPGIGYAVAYPFGIIGIILAILVLRALFRVSLAREGEAFEREQRAGHEPLERMNLRVDNENLDKLPVAQLPSIRELGIVISRIKRRDQTSVSAARENTRVHVGDVLLAVGQRSRLAEFRLIVGEKSDEDLMQASGRVTWKRIVVTAKPVLGKSLHELALDHAYGVTVTRVSRAAVEMPATPELRLQFGDTLQTVGQPESLREATRVLGNSTHELGHTNLVPVFVGIVLGILAGTCPIQVPGIPAPVRLGLAGGPLIVAILLSNVGRIGPLIWYMPPNANTALREMGIVLFLACVGIKAGSHFVEVLVRGDGLSWMAAGAAITLLPLVVVGVAARTIGKLNFVSLSGLLAGSMTDPPALAFANAVCGSDAPSVAYATVYPFSMLLRIVVAQLMVLVFSR